MIQNPVALMAFLFGIIALARFLEARSKLVAHVSSAVVCTLLGMLLANIGVIPYSSPLQGQVYEYAVPYAVVLVILSTDLAAIKAAGVPLLIGFALAAVGSLLGGLIAGPLFAGWVGPETWKVTGAFVAAFVGGGINFVAVGRGLETTPSLFSAANVADNLSTVPWMLAQVGLASLLRHYYPLGVDETAKQAQLTTPVTHDDAASPSGGGDVIDELRENPSRFWSHTSTDVGQMATLAALPLLLLYLSRAMAPLIPGFPEVLWLTTLALVLAQVPALGPMRRTAAVMSYFALHLFFIVLGAGSVVSEVLKAGPSLLIMMTLIIAIHALVVYGVGWLIKLDLASLTIASQATVGGPGSALALSMSLRWTSMATPGIIIGIFGYGVGNYFGFACAYLVRSLQ